MRRSIGFPIGIWALSFFLTSVTLAAESADQPNLKLRYDKPAANWMKEALPIGNGHMGAMIYGGERIERVQFNEESLWEGNEDDTGSYQNFGEVSIKFENDIVVTNPSNHPGSGAESVLATCDNNVNTKWCFEHCGRFPIIWQAALPADRSVPVTSYTLTSGADVVKYTHKSAKDIIIGG